MSAHYSVVVLTGAGISAESGLSTFRGAGGLWEGHRVEDVATPEAWARDPELVWRFYQLRRGLLSTVHPNRAHEALVRLESEIARAGHDFLLVTQNVDDLHERAGSTPLHMHGELLRLVCERCGESRRDERNFEPDRFLSCGACEFERLRPQVVWFGEMPRHMDEIEHALRRCTHFLSIGTSGFVYPAAGFLASARAIGAATVVNSLDEPENLHPGDEFRPGRATQVVPELVDEWIERMGVSP